MINKFNNSQSLTKFVMISLLIVIIYTLAEFICSIVTGMTHDTLTGCVFALFGTEIAVCGFIKIFKIKEE
ncbi:MAG: hypothetical protein J6S67_16565 [Methanobrevibacter sp.]|nr:hypothetical protein [Methanobrevibacter sp.]